MSASAQADAPTGVPGLPRRARAAIIGSGIPQLLHDAWPNCGKGHSSAFTLVEAQAHYVVDAVRAIDAQGLSSVEVRGGAGELQ